uniref:Uncharacterized protein n=1 Tax=Pithovirus LCPAC104 TaxID=2506589 RepID=A0A481Z5F3_9VIRU|nr:MAG: hypothetical protein LCPAC104_01590 [Pithovirus LCPAC104]
MELTKNPERIISISSITISISSFLYLQNFIKDHQTQLNEISKLLSESVIPGLEKNIINDQQFPRIEKNLKELSKIIQRQNAIVNGMHRSIKNDNKAMKYILSSIIELEKKFKQTDKDFRLERDPVKILESYNKNNLNRNHKNNIDDSSDSDEESEFVEYIPKKLRKKSKRNRRTIEENSEDEDNNIRRRSRRKSRENRYSDDDKDDIEDVLK